MGFTAILVDSSIMQSFRDLMFKTLPESVYKVFECYQCMGFWSGVINGAILILPYKIGSVDSPLLLVCGGLTILFVSGCAGSVLSMFWGLFSTYLEARSIVNLGSDKNE